MSVAIFGVGVLVFFLTIYGTVVGGGLRLTRHQLETSPELAPRLTPEPGAPADTVSTRDVIRGEF